jgi:hypothetical protein
MTPRPALNHGPDGRVVDAELSGQSAHGFARFLSLAKGAYLGFGEFRQDHAFTASDAFWVKARPALIPTRSPALHRLVSHVGGVCSQPQMTEATVFDAFNSVSANRVVSDTGGRVARVKDMEIIWDGAIMKSPSDAMGADGTTIGVQTPVTRFACEAGPEPTRVGLADLRPETIGNRPWFRAAFARSCRWGKIKAHRELILSGATPPASEIARGHFVASHFTTDGVAEPLRRQIWQRF